MPPSPAREETPPGLGERAVQRRGRQGPENPGAGTFRSGIRLGQEHPGGESRRLTVSQHKEGQAEPWNPVPPSDPTVIRGEAGSIRSELQVTVPGSSQQGEYPQRFSDGSNTGFNPAAHALTRILSTTKAEHLLRSLHQLQSEGQRFTARHYNSQGGPGSVARSQPPPGREQDSVPDISLGEASP